MQSFTRGQQLLLRVAPPLAHALLAVLAGTLRWQPVYATGARPADVFPAEPDVYVFWHRAILLAAWRYRGLGIRILISESFDGELISRLVQRLGFVPVRGSSTRGGAAALLAATRARREGHKVAITADGPKGPAGIAKEGAATIAGRSESSASCFHLEPSSAWALDSWDRFLIPKPFSTVRIAWEPTLNMPTTFAIQKSLEAAVAAAQQPQSS